MKPGLLLGTRRIEMDDSLGQIAKIHFGLHYFGLLWILILVRAEQKSPFPPFWHGQPTNSLNKQFSSPPQIGWIMFTLLVVVAVFCCCCCCCCACFYYCILYNCSGDDCGGSSVVVVVILFDWTSTSDAGNSLTQQQQQQSQQQQRVFLHDCLRLPKRKNKSLNLQSVFWWKLTINFINEIINLIVSL